MSRIQSPARQTRTDRSQALRNAPALFCALAVLLLFGGAAKAQDAQITGISVSEATVGTEFLITGSGFGTKPPTVFLAQDGVRVKGTTLRASRPDNPGLVSVVVNKAIVGTYSVVLDPAGKSNGPGESDDTIEIVRPEIMGIDGSTTVMPNDMTSVLVNQAGTKGVRVFVAGYKTKVLSIDPAGGEGEQVLSSISFRIPKKVPAGLWDVEVINKVGGTMLPGALTVVGATSKLGKPKMRGSSPGASDLKVKAKQIEVDSSFNGPTTVVGAEGKKSSRRLELVLPFSLGSEQAPASFSSSPALIRVIDSLGREWETVDDSFLISVGASRDGLVSGSFAGDVFPVEEGGEVLPVYGTFTYDGEHQLPDGGGNTNPDLGKGEESPGMIIQVLELAGSKGPTGNFKPGDTLSVRFRMVKTDGTTWHLDEMDSTRAIVSGPTFNYQRLIGQVSDIEATSIDNGDGSYTYTFPTPIPATYLPPLNDTPDFDEDDGELTGQPLIDGTYTVGMYFYWRYTAGDSSYREVGSTTVDFLIGTSVAAIESREVVGEENCNACHSDMQFHGGTRKGITLCLMCHTAGSEDRNNATAGGTPGTTVEFSVMIHKIHNGAHLPSVNGVLADATGIKDYTVTPRPYQIVGYGNAIHDYSDVEFPAWPNFTSGMPRDFGYSDLDEFTGQEDAILKGITSCNLCHGDPDGTGPIAPPSQGEQAYETLRRNTCGSCHDDWVHDQPYTSNLMTMPSQIGDETCSQCHPRDGIPLAVEDAHLHPLLTPTFATGINFDILAVTEAGADDSDGTVDPGEKVAVTFTLSDDMGLSIDPAVLTGRSIMLTGPTSNENMILPEQALPAEMLTGSQPYTVNLPTKIYYEYLGDATSDPDTFNSLLTPHWNVPGQATTVMEQTAFGEGDSVLSEDIVPPVNYIDVADVDGFLRGDYVLIDDGNTSQEYLQIQNVEGDRLWFSSPYTQAYAPGPVGEHDAGTSVTEVKLTTLTEDIEYALTKATGAIMETGGFGDDNPLVVSYTADFIMPETYAMPLNTGPDLGERFGDWAQKSLVEGTYSVVMWGSHSLTLSLFGENNSYREGAAGNRKDFLVGAASSIQPYQLISSVENCNACHVDIQFHGSNRRGFESCFACHATAGTGDRPRYVAPGAPATDGVTINFREMIHKIHRGGDLDKADTYSVNGYGFAGNYPNNYTGHSYGHVTFPSMPEGTQDCSRCHGEDNTAWQTPSNRQHPTEQGIPVQEWNIACGSCHDSNAEQAHMQSQSSPIDGAESCLICHGAGQTWDVESMHQIR